MEGKMDKPPKLPYMPNRIACAMVFLTLSTSAVITFGVNRQPPQQQASQVLNKTSALEIVSVVPGQNSSLVVTVKNVLRDKNITGVAFRNGNAQIESDFISGFGDY